MLWHIQLSLHKPSFSFLCNSRASSTASPGWMNQCAKLCCHKKMSQGHTYVSVGVILELNSSNWVFPLSTYELEMSHLSHPASRDLTSIYKYSQQIILEHFLCPLAVDRELIASAVSILLFHYTLYLFPWCIFLSVGEHVLHWCETQHFA